MPHFQKKTLSGIIFWIRRRNADFRGKSVGIVALTSGSILFAMYPYLRYIVEGKNKISFGQYLIFLLIILLYLLLPVAARETERRQENEKFLRALDQRYEIEKQRLDMIEAFAADQRKIEHDFNNQMMVVMGMMAKGERKAAVELLGEMEKRIEK